MATTNLRRLVNAVLQGPINSSNASEALTLPRLKFLQPLSSNPSQSLELNRDHDPQSSLAGQTSVVFLIRRLG